MTTTAPVTKKAHWQLTPHPVRSCWRKKHEGYTHYVGKGTLRYSEAEYKAAWDEWEAKLAKLNEAKKPFNISEHADELEAQWSYGLSQPKTKNKPAAPPAEALSKLAEKFVSRKATQVRTGARSGGRYANLRSYVNHFVRFAEDPNVKAFKAATALADYYEANAEDIEEEEISSTTASDRMQSARQFIRYLWESTAINDLPRNLDSKEMTFSRVVGNPVPMPLPALRRRVKAAKGKLKLELLLMANCGYTQKDCADLLHTEIDWKVGTITRQRSKKVKGKDQNVPTVTWYLWPSTLHLLREHATQDNTHVLANRNGLAGVRTDIKADGTVSRTDNTRTAYARLQESLAKTYEEEIKDMKKADLKKLIEAGELDADGVFKTWRPKSIRKAAATAIEGSKEFSRFTQYFLGQAPETVAQTHYAAPSEEQFQKCCEWLGEFFDLADVAKCNIEPKADPEATN